MPKLPGNRNTFDNERHKIQIERAELKWQWRQILEDGTTGKSGLIGPTDKMSYPEELMYNLGAQLALEFDNEVEYGNIL